MTVIGVPYHLDELLPDPDFPITPTRLITAGLPAGDTWDRMAERSAPDEGAARPPEAAYFA